MSTAAVTPQSDKFSGEDLAALTETYRHLKETNDPRADKVGGFIRATVQSGNFEPVDPKNPDHAGFWASLGSDLWGMAQSAPRMALPGGFAGKEGAGAGLKYQQTGELPASQALQHNQEQKKAGYSLAYRAASPIAENLAGANVRGMEQSAQEGDVAGVAGHAAAPLAVLAATEGVSRGAAKLGESLPSKSGAGAALKQIRSEVGNVPIQTAKVGDTALQLYEQSQRGATFPSAVNKLVKRQTTPDAAPLTYAEAKDFQSNISDLSANEKMNLKPNQVRLLGQLNADLKASLAEAADTAGKGGKFTQAMKEYHQAMKLRGYSDMAIDIAWKSAISATGLGLVGYGIKKALE